jgi:hypothetical protein
MIYKGEHGENRVAIKLTGDDRIAEYASAAVYLSNEDVYYIGHIQIHNVRPRKLRKMATEATEVEIRALLEAEFRKDLTLMADDDKDKP